MQDRVVLIGRGPNNDIVLRNPSVSIRHARVVVSKDGLLLEDLGSRNGTFVGSPPKRISSQTIVLEEPLTFGDALLPAVDMCTLCALEFMLVTMKDGVLLGTWLLR